MNSKSGEEEQKKVITSADAGLYLCKRLRAEKMNALILGRVSIYILGRVQVMKMP